MKTSTFTQDDHIYLQVAGGLEKMSAAKEGSMPKKDEPLVLVVDDFADAREMYGEYLKFCGFRVAEARTATRSVSGLSIRGYRSAAWPVVTSVAIG